MTSLETCQVCLLTPKAKQRIQIHYGGKCCFACKAFFRRIHQSPFSDQSPSFRCGDACDSTGTSIRRCKSCRYSRCLQAGMVAQLVLQGQDRKKHTFAKKRSKLSQDNASSSGILDAMISQCFSNFILAEAETHIEATLMRKIIEGHAKPDAWNFTHTDAILFVIGAMKQLIHSFAVKNSCFMSLSSSDRSILLRYNGNLYIQYNVAKYLTRSNGFDQVSTLFGANMPLLAHNLLLLSMPVSFDILNQGGQFVSIDDPAKIMGFKQCLMDVKFMFTFPVYLNGLLLNYFLFNSDGIEADLEDLKRIRYIDVQSQEMVLHEVKNKNLLESLPRLKTTLLLMTKLSSFQSSPILAESSFLETCFITNEEINFIRKSVGYLQTIFEDIHPDDNFFALYKKPFKSRHYFQAQMLLNRMFRARFQTVLKKLSASNVLSVPEKAMQLGIFINLLRINAEPSLEHQMAFLRGRAKPLESQRSVSHDVFSMVHQIDKCKVSAQNFQNLFQQLGKFLQEDNIFYQVLLCILLPDNALMLKMLAHQLSTMPEYAFVPNPALLYSSFLRNLEEIINIFETCYIPKRDE